MNPWRSLRAEILGALRSVRYDLAVKRTRRRMNSDTVLLPIIKERKGKHRTVYVAGVILLPVAGFSGYMAVTSGLGALVAEAGTAGGLPYVEVPPVPTSAAPPSAAPMSAEPAILASPHKFRPPPSPRPPSLSPSISPPVPTPAPTKSCPPSPRPSATPSPGPTSTPSPSSSPTP